MKWTDETRIATWPEGGASHCANNLYFTRREDGSVTIRHYPSLDVGTEPDISVDCTPEEWASVVASMQAGGETLRDVGGGAESPAAMTRPGGPHDRGHHTLSKHERDGHDRQIVAACLLCTVDSRNAVISELEAKLDVLAEQNESIARELDKENDHYEYALERLDKIEKAIRDLPRLDHDFCIDYNVKQAQKRYDDRPWDELAEDHREWHRLRTARATELLRNALNSGSSK